MVVWEQLDALSRQLELCGVDVDTSVAVFVDDQVDRERRQLVQAGLARVGADAVIVQAVTAEPPSALLSRLADAVDLVITIGDSGPVGAVAKRHLAIGPADPSTFPPHQQLRIRTEALERALSESQHLAVDDDAGTDLVVDLVGGSITGHHGLLTDGRASASYPAGWVTVLPRGHAVEGSLILVPGDAALTGHDRFWLRSPIRLSIQAGHLVAIDGESPDADVLRATLEYADDPAAYRCSEVTIGLNPGRSAAQRFDTRLTQHDQAHLLAGVTTIGFGAGYRHDGIGPATTRLVLVGRSVVAEGLPIVSRGELQGDFAPDIYER